MTDYAHKKSARPISLDVETSGINPNETALLSIGAATGKPGDSSYSEFYIEIQPPEGLRIEDGAMRINGLSIEKLKAEGVPEKEALEKFIQWVKNHEDWTVLGQNPSFDLGFIRAACTRNGLRTPFPVRSIDLHSLAISVMAAKGGYPIKPSYHDPSGYHTCSELDTILEYVGINKRNGAHNALDDAKLTLEAWQRLVRYMFYLLHPDNAEKAKLSPEIITSALYQA